MTSSASRTIKSLNELRNIKLDNLRFRVVDAKDQIVGRLAAQIATILQGKDKPIYNPKRNDGDVVIVVNAAHVRFTHDKWETKLYRWHSEFPGGLKERCAVDQWERDPTRILTTAVRGMLPKNKLRLPRMDKLKIFPEHQHPYKSLDMVPFVPPVHRVPDRGLGWKLPAGFVPLSPERYTFRAITAQRVREAARPSLDFSDLLNSEERRAVLSDTSSSRTATPSPAPSRAAAAAAAAAPAPSGRRTSVSAPSSPARPRQLSTSASARFSSTAAGYIPSVGPLSFATANRHPSRTSGSSETGQGHSNTERHGMVTSAAAGATATSAQSSSSSSSSSVSVLPHDRLDRASPHGSASDSNGACSEAAMRPCSSSSSTDVTKG